MMKSDPYLARIEAFNLKTGGGVCNPQLRLDSESPVVFRVYPNLSESILNEIALEIGISQSQCATGAGAGRIFPTRDSAQPLWIQNRDSRLSRVASPSLDFVHYEGKQSAYSSRLNKRD